MSARAAVRAVLLVALAGAVAGCGADAPPPPPPPPIRAVFDAPPDAELGAGDDILDAALSPNGRAIVFVATSAGVSRLWRRTLDADRAEAVPGTEGAMMPVWTRDAGAISFFAGGRLRQRDLAAERTRDLAAAPEPAGAAWLPDGSLLFAPDARGPLQRLRDGRIGEATTSQDGDVGHAFPEAVGDSGAFLYVARTANGRRVVRLVRSGGGEVDLTRTSGHAAMAGDLLVHVDDGALTVQRLDVEAGALVGRPARLAFDVGVSASGRAFFAASPRTIVWAPAAPRPYELAWLDRQGTRLGALADPGDYWQARLSPGDRMAAATMLDPLLRTLDVVVVPAGDRTFGARRVTLSLSADSDPVWSPDGARVVFRSWQGGRPNLFARPPQFSEAPDQVILESDLDETASDWRGNLLLFHAPGETTGLDVWLLDMRTGERRAVTRGGLNESDARWSPDGRAIAYVSDEPGRPQIVVERWPQNGRQWAVTSAGGTKPRWGHDGRTLFFLRGSVLMETTLTARDPEVRFSPARRVADLPGVRDIAPSQASDRLLAVLPVARATRARAGLIVDWMGALPGPAQ